MAPTENVVDNPFFARLWSAMSTREPAVMTRLRRENLTGLTGRVLEVGAGTGTNFALYPDTVEQVVAIEPEARLAVTARAAAAAAPVPVEVIGDTIEGMGDAAPFDAVVCSLVLCSLADPDTVLRQLYSRLRPGGELRYLEHIATPGLRGGLQRVADATIWPRLLGNCHTHRDTERSIRAAGFEVGRARHEQTLPAWVPLPVWDFAIGRAVSRG
jgi:protein-L-isoaspartate O-methyltransferase